MLGTRLSHACNKLLFIPLVFAITTLPVAAQNYPQRDDNHSPNQQRTDPNQQQRQPDANGGYNNCQRDGRASDCAYTRPCCTVDDYAFHAYIKAHARLDHNQLLYSIVDKSVVLTGKKAAAGN